MNVPKNSGKSPAFQFYYKDWLADNKLNRISKKAKGVWIDLMAHSCHMQKKGVFRDENGPLSESELIQMMTGKKSENVSGLKELIDKKIIKRDDKGMFYVKRIKEDTKLSEIRKATGRLGGNPVLVKGLVNQNSNQNTPSSSSTS